MAKPSSAPPPETSALIKELAGFFGATPDDALLSLMHAPPPRRTRDPHDKVGFIRADEEGVLVRDRAPSLDTSAPPTSGSLPEELAQRGLLVTEVALERFFHAQHDTDFPEMYRGLRRVHGLLHLGHVHLELRREGEGTLDIIAMTSPFAPTLPSLRPTTDRIRKEFGLTGTMTGAQYGQLLQLAQRIPVTLPLWWDRAAHACDELRDLVGDLAQRPRLLETPALPNTLTRFERLRAHSRESLASLIGGAVRLKATLDLLETFETGHRVPRESPSGYWIDTVGITVKQGAVITSTRTSVERLKAVIAHLQERERNQESRGTLRSAIIAVAKEHGFRTNARGLPAHPVDRLRGYEIRQWEQAAYEAWTPSLREALESIEERYGARLTPGALVKAKTDLNKLFTLI